MVIYYCSMDLKQATFLSFCNYLQVKKSVKETEKSNDDEDSDEWEFEDKSLSEILIEVVSIFYNILVCFLFTRWHINQ